MPDLGPNCLQMLSAVGSVLAQLVLKVLSFCMLFFKFFLAADFFQNQLFQKILPGIPYECQTVWIQIRPDILLGLIPGTNCLQMLSADDTCTQNHTFTV